MAVLLSLTMVIAVTALCGYLYETARLVVGYGLFDIGQGLHATCVVPSR